MRGHYQNKVGAEVPPVDGGVGGAVIGLGGLHGDAVDGDTLGGDAEVPLGAGGGVSSSAAAVTRTVVAAHSLGGLRGELAALRPGIPP